MCFRSESGQAENLAQDMADLMHDFDVVSRWENDIWDNTTVCLNFIWRRQRKYLFDISHIYALNTSDFSSSSLNPYN